MHCTLCTARSEKAREDESTHILVVEDSRSVGELLACALEQEGCSVVLARTGAQGVALAHRLQPDVIALDVGRACLEGTDVILALATDAATRDIPIIALSARTADLAPALGCEVSRVFGEPFYPAEVVAAVLQLLDELKASRTARPATPR